MGLIFSSFYSLFRIWQREPFLNNVTIYFVRYHHSQPYYYRRPGHDYDYPDYPLDVYPQGAGKRANMKWRWVCICSSICFFVDREWEHKIATYYEFYNVTECSMAAGVSWKWLFRINGSLKYGVKAH